MDEPLALGVLSKTLTEYPFFANALANASPRIPAPIIFTDLFIGF
jgi:hypothetical protein